MEEEDQTFRQFNQADDRDTCSQKEVKGEGKVEVEGKEEESGF